MRGSHGVNDLQAMIGLLYARIPGARPNVIAQAGHRASRENPEELNKAVMDFLNQLN